MAKERQLQILLTVSVKILDDGTPEVSPAIKADLLGQPLAKNGRRIPERSPLWLAVKERWSLQDATGRGVTRINGIVKELTAAGCQSPQDLEAAERAYHDAWPDADWTADAAMKHYSTVRNGRHKANGNGVHMDKEQQARLSELFGGAH